MIITTFHCVKACGCAARSIRQPLLALVVRDAEEEVYSPERVGGSDYKLLVYPSGEVDSLVVCPTCNIPWTMTVGTEVRDEDSGTWRVLGRDVSYSE